MKTGLIISFLFPALLWAASIPKQIWKVDTESKSGHALDLIYGETMDIEVQFLSYKSPIDLTDYTLTLHAKTNLDDLYSYQVPAQPGRIDDPSAASNGWGSCRVVTDEWLPPGVEHAYYTLEAIQGTNQSRLLRGYGDLSISGTAATSTNSPVSTGGTFYVAQIVPTSDIKPSGSGIGTVGLSFTPAAASNIQRGVDAYPLATNWVMGRGYLTGSSNLPGDKIIAGSISSNAMDPILDAIYRSGGGGSTGGIADAPTDGQMYARSNLTWRAFLPGSGGVGGEPFWFAASNRVVYTSDTSLAIGDDVSAGDYSLAQGLNVHVGNNAVGQGIGVTAGNTSYGSGLGVTAGNQSWAQGLGVTAGSWASAVGADLWAGDYSLAHGRYTKALLASIAQGVVVTAGISTLAQGQFVTAGSYSLAQGQFVTAGHYSFAQGYGLSVGDNEFIWGRAGSVTNHGPYTASFGATNGFYPGGPVYVPSIVLGTNPAVSSWPAGYSTNDFVLASVFNASVSGLYPRNNPSNYVTGSIVTNLAVARGNTSVQIGTNTMAGTSAFVQGTDVSAINDAFAQGRSATAWSMAFAQGYSVGAKNYSFSQGNSVFSGLGSFAQGQSISAGDYAFAVGQYLVATNNEFLWGRGVPSRGQFTASLGASNGFYPNGPIYVPAIGLGTNPLVTSWSSWDQAASDSRIATNWITSMGKTFIFSNSVVAFDYYLITTNPAIPLDNADFAGIYRPNGMSSNSAPIYTNVAGWFLWKDDTGFFWDASTGLGNECFLYQSEGATVDSTWNGTEHCGMVNGQAFGSAVTKTNSCVIIAGTNGFHVSGKIKFEGVATSPGASGYLWSSNGILRISP